MRHINEVASWFNKNNILKVDEETDNLRINLLCLYTKIAYIINNINLECEEVQFSNEKIYMGVSDYNLDVEFNDEELKILQIINRELGYLNMQDLLYPIISFNKKPTYENLYNHLKKDISDSLEGYDMFQFNENVVIVNDKIFYVNNKIDITDELIEIFKNHSFEDQYIFTVYESDDIEGPIIY